ncbi:iron ABC transporter permease [Clostridium sediminicola]
MILFIVVFMALLLVVFPSLVLILKSVGISFYDGGALSFQAYKEIFKDSYTFSAIVNTLVTSLAVTMMTILIGGSLAWLVTRTDFPYKKFIRNNVFFTFTIPSYILGISWLELLGRNGYVDKFFKLFNINDFKFQTYSVWAVIIIMTIHLYPLVFMALSNALSKTDNSLEDATVLSGASRFKGIMTITIPLIMPSIFSIGLFVFSRTMANFGVPALLLMPLYKETLTTRIYRALNDLNLSLAAAIAIILVIFVGLAFLLQNLILRKKKFTLVTSDSSLPRLINLGKRNKFISVLVIIFQICTTIIPLATIFVSSFLKRWGLPLILKNLTIANYYNLFGASTSIRAFKNSIIYGIIAACIAVIIGAIISYVSNNSIIKGGKFIEFIASWPMSFPNIVMAIAAILAWSRPPINFYGKSSIIIITYIALFLPIALKNISGLIQNQDITLEKAARVSGASKLQTYRDITFPMIKPGMKSSWVLCIIIALREIPISLMLHAPGTETVGVLLFNMRSNSSGLEAISAISVVVIMLSIIGRLFVRKIKNSKGSVS